MNKIRRKKLEAILAKLEELKEELEEVQGEEEEAKENIPESLWGTERYELAEAACENLDYAVNAFDELVEYIESAAE